MCCKGKEIPYKDYTPQDQLGLRQGYNQQALSGLKGGATPYPDTAAFMYGMNPAYDAAMRSMYAAGGMNPSAWQPPQFQTWGQTQQMYNPQGYAQQQAQQQGMQQLAGGGFSNINPMGGRLAGSQGTPQGQIPYWLMMPGMGGGNPQGGGRPQQ